VRIKDEFRLDDVEAARSIVRAHPFATIVTADLRATHMPCLVDDGDGLAILGHVACPDPVSEVLGGPVGQALAGQAGGRAGSGAGRPRPPRPLRQPTLAAAMRAIGS
jgi:hypothetical protein